MQTCYLQEVEGEYHFQHKCTNYLSQKQALDLEINDLYPNIKNLDGTLRLIYLLSAGIDVAK